MKDQKGCGKDVYMDDDGIEEEGIWWKCGEQFNTNVIALCPKCKDQDHSPQSDKSVALKQTKDKPESLASKRKINSGTHSPLAEEAGDISEDTPEEPRSSDGNPLTVSGAHSQYGDEKVLKNSSNLKTANPIGTFNLNETKFFDEIRDTIRMSLRTKEFEDFIKTLATIQHEEWKKEFIKKLKEDIHMYTDDEANDILLDVEGVIDKLAGKELLSEQYWQEETNSQEKT
ncbi:hypothetical protein LCGC14_0476180 [marine sediment metagenome]|uniref:Uncharacterized protein n=1 Tax=marine sediment metagenome TaxID=412755 RepID=A0A0F9SAJ2_9ZZZZ